MYDQNTQTNGLTERIKLLTNSSSTNYYLIPGRNKDSFNAYAYTQLYNTEYGENYFNYGLYYYFNEFINNVNTPISELQGKDLDYFRNIGRTILSIRHVVVYGSTKGRIVSINMNDYNGVKRVLNLRD
ncbi:MAG: hypothetical protein U5N85_01845 [Arcicella sp.]|nr:hypothetical protein [Arcicella sp.]